MLLYLSQREQFGANGAWHQVLFRCSDTWPCRTCFAGAQSSMKFHIWCRKKWAANRAFHHRLRVLFLDRWWLIVSTCVTELLPCWYAVFKRVQHRRKLFRVIIDGDTWSWGDVYLKYIFIKVYWRSLSSVAFVLRCRHSWCGRQWRTFRFTCRCFLLLFAIATRKDEIKKLNPH